MRRIGGAALDEALPKRFGKYTLIKKLATGGMAELFLALHRSVAGFEKLIVIKRILPTLSADQGFVDMFLAEARIAATLNHPNIVQIFDLGSVDDRYFIAMEFIHGEDLRSIVRAMRKLGTHEFPIEHALSIGLGLLAGLGYAHEKKNFEGEPLHMVHRDISPQNILVTFTGDVKVVDFGIAKTGVKKEDTKAGQLKGKVPYMSPEQCRGESLDARSDVFSAGIILYELTTNKRLFRSQSEFHTLRMIVEGTYPVPTSIRPGYPAALETIVMKALEKDRDKRYQSARVFQEDVETFIREERMKVGASGLATFMGSLFEEKLAAQNEALKAGRQLAEVIAAQEEERASHGGRTGEYFMLSDADLEEMGTPSTMAQSPLAKAEAGRGPGTRAWMVEQQKRGSRRLLLAVLAVLMIVGAVGGSLVYSRYGQTDPGRGARPTGSIVLSSDPPGAAIKLNGEITPWRTPHKITKLPVGATYGVKLVLDGFDPWAQSLGLTTGSPNQVVRAVLRRTSAASLAIVKVTTVPAGAAVILDGTETNQKTPAQLTGVQPGVQHMLLVQLQGYVDKQVPLSLEPNQVADLAFELERAPLAEGEALLKVTTEPADAELVVGSTTYRSGSPYEVRVSAGRSTSIAVAKVGYTPYRREVRPNSRETVELTVSLERERRTPHPGPAPSGGAPGSLVLDSRPWCNVTIDGVARGQTPIVNLSLPAGQHTGRCVNPQFNIAAGFSFTIRSGETTRKRLVHDSQ
ncbi:MAG: serine/threonine protein kinase [Deltaproteobacteria bacterium]|nr:serine/threonine protein kinase [Deltaproteobacteria bacterium]